MRRAHGSAKIFLTEEEALALEADRTKWPSNWAILSHQRRKAKPLLPHH